VARVEYLFIQFNCVIGESVSLLGLLEGQD